jgi:hypothetical protein
VLAAGETAMNGTDLPDEAVSVPSGLLQAGAIAALVSLWAVPTHSTALPRHYFSHSAWRDHGVEQPWHCAVPSAGCVTPRTTS